MSQTRRRTAAGRILWVSPKQALLNAKFDVKDYREPDSSADLWWTDKDIRPDDFKDAPPGQVVNKIPMMSTICWKPDFFELLRLAVERCKPTVLPPFFPKSFPLKPGGDVPSLDELLTGDAPWIMKPATGQCGRGIRLLFPSNLDPLSEINVDTVLQAYLPPLLLDDGPFVRHKWDCRFYVFLEYNGPKGSPIQPECSIYLYEDGLVKFCSEPYSEPNDDWNQFSHITNLALNIKNEKITGSPMRMWKAMLPGIRDRIARIPAILDYQKDIEGRLEEIVLIIGLAMFGRIREIMAKMELTDRHYFHLLGMDVMFDGYGNPQVLEMNDRPSMIRRPVDENEGQNIAMLEEELRIVFGDPTQAEKTNQFHWKRLYPVPETSRRPRMKAIASRLQGVNLWPSPVDVEPVEPATPRRQPGAPSPFSGLGRQ